MADTDFADSVGTDVRAGFMEGPTVAPRRAPQGDLRMGGAGGRPRGAEGSERRFREDTYGRRKRGMLSHLGADSKTQAWALGGIIVGSIVILVLIIVLPIVLTRKRREAKVHVTITPAQAAPAQTQAVVAPPPLPSAEDTSLRQRGEESNPPQVAGDFQSLPLVQAVEERVDAAMRGGSFVREMRQTPSLYEGRDALVTETGPNYLLATNPPGEPTLEERFTDIALKQLGDAPRIGQVMFRMEDAARGPLGGSGASTKTAGGTGQFRGTMKGESYAASHEAHVLVVVSSSCGHCKGVMAQAVALETDPSFSFGTDVWVVSMEEIKGIPALQSEVVSAVPAMFAIKGHTIVGKSLGAPADLGAVLRGLCDKAKQA